MTTPELTLIEILKKEIMENMEDWSSDSVIMQLHIPGNPPQTILLENREKDIYICEHLIRYGLPGIQKIIHFDNSEGQQLLEFFKKEYPEYRLKQMQSSVDDLIKYLKK